MQGEDKPLPKTDAGLRGALLSGTALWGLFCVVVVILRGPRWDEQYEWAQVIVRAIPYPEGHPLFFFMRNLRNGQLCSASLLFELVPNAYIICGIRNSLFLAATVLPVFLLASLLSRKPLWGHVAALLALAEIHLEFDSCYPTHAWPDFTSTGHVGQGYALLTVCAFVAGRLSTGSFLLGLMPLVHLGQMPMVLAFAILRTGSCLFTGDRRSVLRAGIWLMAGLACWGAFLLSTRSLRIDPPREGPYYSDADPWPIWRAVIETDDLRAAPGKGVSYARANFALAAALLLGLAGTLAARRNRSFDAWFWVWGYLVCLAGIVWTIMILHMVLGPSIPYLLISWMPYRLINHALLILIALIAATLGAETKFNAAGCFVAALAVLHPVLKPVFQAVMPEVWFTRYISTGEGVFFALWGAALAVYLTDPNGDRWFRLFLAVLGSLLFLALAPVHQFGAICSLCGVLGYVVLQCLHREMPDGLSNRLVPRLVVIALTVSVAFHLSAQWWNRDVLPRSSFDREIARTLEARGDGKAMIVARPDQYVLQSRIGHPIMAVFDLITCIPYEPAIGPAVGNIYADLYGIDLTNGSLPDSRDWAQTWTQRSLEQWQKLGTQYDFRYVLSPAHVPLALTPVLTGASETLYEVPRS